MHPALPVADDGGYRHEPVAPGCYDPMAAGARCDVCVLRVWREGGPVPPEHHATDKIAIVGDQPSGEDVRYGRPNVGDAGKELDTALGHAGIKRAQTFLTTAILCRPPGNDYGRLLRRWREENKAREKRGATPWPSPAECCKPRLLREIKPFRDVISLGNISFRALTGAATGVLDVRGTMFDGWIADTRGTGDRYYPAQGPYTVTGPSDDATRLRLSPTVHPSFVLRARRWTRVFREDIARAVRWFDGRLAWVEPRVLIRPTPDQLRTFLFRMNAEGIAACDVETDGIEPLTARLRCVGIGNGNEVCVVPWLRIDGQTRFYSPAEQSELTSILREWLTGPCIKVGHNFGVYDRLNLEQHFGVTPTPILDTILLHRLVESELPHNLGFVASVYADVSPAWKADRTAITAETDRDLHVYNAYDVALNLRVLPKLVDHVKLRDQAAVYGHDAHRQAMCAEMHRVGMLVDQRVRLGHEYRLGMESWEWLQNFRELSGNPKINPASVNQVRELLFETLGLAVPETIMVNGRGMEVVKPMLTGGGDPSTGDEALRALLASPATSDRARRIIFALRRVRASDKLLGTYVVKLRPMTEDASEGIDLDDVPTFDGLPDGARNDGGDEYEAMERVAADRKGQRERKRGCVFPDGRMHPDYVAHGTTSGRLSSKRPNATNFPSVLRDMIVAGDDHILVGADQAQLELRVGAALWQIEAYKKALNLGADPHATTAYMALGQKFLDAAGWPAGRRMFDGGRLYFFPDPGAKWKGLAKMLRDLAKRLQYASQYRASVETVWRVITSSEDEKGRLIYADMKVPEVRLMYDQWIAGVPEIPRGWETEVQAYRAHGFLREPVLGRQRDFLDGENPQELANFRTQAAGTGIMALAERPVRAAFPCLYAGPGTGIINQCHDSLVLEVPKADAERVARVLEASMTMTLDCLPGVRFVGEADIGTNWKAV